ncbi:MULTISPECIES: DUF1819 family protein [unclassified Leptotrichia]|jgi:hypothetical protein|uniref:DUF1819 family protein n=1 Tax=unclassified Leptotrichia TaxID=2633022 RepID=UPI0003AE3C46|nr:MULTISPECIES: DUF1819 family protein [unclassified Leptotrichia]ERL25946.1 putative inner membrane protein DUF1819 [Leptotrichia sp. oral taxon 225 str. F0581]WLD74295.1 DUF1819 family protein [Leptotrichia sp. HMT-225]
MKKKEYSAGIVSKGFWFLEFKKFLELLIEGKSESEIKELQEEKNIFSAPSKDYGKRIISEINKRIKVLPEEIKELFFKSDTGTQKVINLLSIMGTDKLFFEYVYNSYRNELLLGTKEYNPGIVMKFLKEKAEQNEEVAKFSEKTLKRMQGTYGNYLKEAGLLEGENKEILYGKVYLDYELEKLLMENNMEVYIKTLKGEV